MFSCLVRERLGQIPRASRPRAVPRRGGSGAGVVSGGTSAPMVSAARFTSSVASSRDATKLAIVASARKTSRSASGRISAFHAPAGRWGESSRSSFALAKGPAPRLKRGHRQVMGRRWIAQRAPCRRARRKNRDLRDRETLRGATRSPAAAVSPWGAAHRRGAGTPPPFARHHCQRTVEVKKPHFVRALRPYARSTGAAGPQKRKRPGDRARPPVVVFVAPCQRC
jgi:hypothetical protein